MSKQILFKIGLLYVIPVMIAGITMSVITLSYHNVMLDEFCLLAVLLISSIIYIKEKGMIVSLLLFGIFLLMIDIGPTDSGGVLTLLKHYAESLHPAPRDFDLHDFIDYQDNVKYQIEIKKIMGIITYATLISAAFAVIKILMLLRPPLMEKGS